ncbi:MAG: hypothetical protein ACRD2L_21960 [Terriglobia bacterium]
MIDQAYNFVMQHKEQLLEVFAMVVVLSRAIAALTPSKADDELAGKFERIVRKTLEVTSGAGHRSLIVKTDAEPVIEPVENILPPDPLAAFENMLARFGAQIKIVPKDK